MTPKVRAQHEISQVIHVSTHDLAYESFLIVRTTKGCFQLSSPCRDHKVHPGYILLHNILNTYTLQPFHGIYVKYNVLEAESTALAASLTLVFSVLCDLTSSGHQLASVLIPGSS